MCSYNMTFIKVTRWSHDVKAFASPLFTSSFTLYNTNNKHRNRQQLLHHATTSAYVCLPSFSSSVALSLAPFHCGGFSSHNKSRLLRASKPKRLKPGKCVCRVLRSDKLLAWYRFLSKLELLCKLKPPPSRCSSSSLS